MTKLIPKYVILDKLWNIIEHPQDVKSEEKKLRIYDRELMATVVTIHSEDLDFNLYAAKECVAALDQYVPPEPELFEIPEGDGNNGD